MTSKDPCPNCGWVAETEMTGVIEDEVAAGFTAGRNGQLCIVPQEYEKTESRAGSWKHGWRQGHAVRVVMTRDR